MNESAARSRAAGGFTLVELLIVMTIIGVLSIALLPQITGSWGLGYEAQTRERIAQLQAMINKYESAIGDYPPSDFARSMKGVQADSDPLNSGVECLVIHLHQERLAGGLTLDDKRDWLDNTDQDVNSTEIPELFTSEKFEVVDAWGMPIAYFHNSAYGKNQIIVPGGEESDGEPRTVSAMSDDRGYLNRRKFQLISAGEDGEFGTDDDITFPTRSTG